MLKTGNSQVNTKLYWNYIYTTPAKAQEYWSATNRFPRALTYIKDGDRVMDLGCGVGVFGSMIKKERKGCEIWGIDISDEVIKDDLQRDPDIHFFQGYIGNLKDIPDEYFDVVFSGETIEHLDNPNDLFADAYRLLKDGGRLIITTPQENHIKSPEHVWYFGRKDIEEMYCKTGFKKPIFEDLPDLEYLLVIFAVGEK